MKRSIILITIFLAGFVQADVYKYINKQGKTAYSDTPVKGAEKVIVPPIMTYEAPNIPTKKIVTSEERKELTEANIPYDHLSIISPIEQGTVRSNQGIVNVTYDLQPALQEEDTVELLLDGVVQEGFNLEGVERGAHVVQVQVIDKNGEVKINSPGVTFYLQRSTAS